MGLGRRGSAANVNGSIAASESSSVTHTPAPLHTVTHTSAHTLKASVPADRN